MDGAMSANVASHAASRPQLGRFQPALARHLKRVARDGPRIIDAADCVISSRRRHFHLRGLDAR
jgi:hypothetical protein